MELKREIRRWDLVLLMVNSIIGAGIFGLPSKTFKLVGIYSIPALFICAAFVFIFVLTFAEVASRFDKTGGPYLYTLEAFGKVPGFIVGWILLITRVATYAALIHLLVSYLSYFFPLVDTPLYRSISIVLITLFFMAPNYKGIKDATRLSNVLAVAKIIPLFLFVLVGLFFIKPDLIQFNQALPELSGLSSSVFILIFAFSGFEAILVNTGEIQKPKKNIPFALITSIVFVAIFYAFIQFVCIGTFPDLAQSEKPIADAAFLFAGPTGAALISLGAVISISGTLHTVMLVGSRMPFAFAEEDQFPKLFSSLHKIYRTPVLSLILFSAVTILVSITGSFMYAVSISVISKVMIFLAVCAALIKLRKEVKLPTQDYFKLKNGKLIAVLGILISLFLLSSSNWNEFKMVIIFILAGIILFVIHSFTSKKSAHVKEK